MQFQPKVNKSVVEEFNLWLGLTYPGLVKPIWFEQPTPGEQPVFSLGFKEGQGVLTCDNMKP